MADDTEIAIVGVGCRFPGADDLQGFWRVLKNGENHIVDIPNDRWDIDSFYDADPNASGKSYVKKAGLIKSLERWDNHFFGINDVEATRIDPQQRLVLDCVHMALENGGFTRKEMDGSLTGVYIGAMNDDYSTIAMGDTSTNNYTVTGTQRSIISARVSYVYNLQGPAMSIDTACSSSLVAINIGSQALKLGECNMAVCGGVNYLMDPNLFVALSKARMLSPTGQCQAFSADADGYARGEGCGIVVLKRLEDEALRDHNAIWGTIKVATNQDGHVASPITAPSGLQQTVLLEHVYSNSHTDKSSIQVIEAHGTGTPIGDPVEANALGGYFQGSGKTVHIGSVKTNIGHLESAAGVAGLIKILLMMKYNTIVPSLMYRPENENPKLNLARYGLKVPTACMFWENMSGKYRMGCVNSFGFGGTNAHAIIKEHLTEQNGWIKPSTDNKHSASLIVLSADVPKSLGDSIKHLKGTLESEDVDITSLAFTSQFKRDHRKIRKTFSALSRDDLLSKLSQFSENDVQSRTTCPVNFVFCGVGTTWNGMGKEMMTNRIFSHTIGEIDCHLKRLTGWSVGDRFLEGFSFTDDPMSNHIAIFAYQVGLDALWKAAGIRPNAVLGQSVGEVAAAYSAGYLDLKSATQIIFYRSKFLANVKTGKMVVVKNVDVAEIELFCKEKGGTLTIAILNSYRSCTLAGEAHEIEDACNFIKQKHDNAVIIQLDVQCAYHSEHVRGSAQALKMEVNKLNMSSNETQTPFFSTVTGRLEDDGTICSADYWQKNVRMHVKFGETVQQSASGMEYIIFLEIGPAPVLRAHIQDIISKEQTKAAVAFPSVTRNIEMDTFTASLGKLFEHGINPTWDAIFPSKAKLSSLPKYVFRDKKCTLYKALTSTSDSAATNKKHLFIEMSRQENGENGFCMKIDPVQTSFISDHKVKKKVVVPGAMYADTAFFLGINALKISDTNAEISLDFLSPMMLSENTTVTLQIKVRPVSSKELEFVIKSGSIAKCKGRVRQKPTLKPTEGTFLGIDGIEARICRNNSEYFTREKIYDLLAGLGFQYGPSFCMIQGCVATEEEGLIDVRVPNSVLKDVDKTFIHPCILDSAIQSCFFGFTNEVLLKNTMPASIEAIHIYRKSEQAMKIHARRTGVTSLETTLQIHFNVTSFNTKGELIFHVENFTIFIRKAGWKVPVELQYTLSLRPVENRTPPKTPLKTLFVLTDETNPELIHKLQSAEQVRGVTMFSYSMPELTESGADVIVVLLESYNSDDKSRSSIDVYNRIKDNCWKLVELMRYLMTNGGSIPLIIATKNAQLITPDNSNKCISIFGPEVWGFIRSVQTEFVLKDVTLVDLQPTLETTLDTFIRFVADKGNERIRPNEVIIRNSEILQLELNRLPKSTFCPTVRVSSMTETSCQETFVFLPDVGNASRPYTAIMRSNQKPMNTTVGMTSIRIQTVYRHQISLFSDRLNDVSDMRLHGIEYTGIEEGKGRNGFLQCRGDSVASCDDFNIERQFRLIVVFPALIQPRMKVPRKCVISSRAIPFYRPGMFVYGLIFWEITKHVQERSSVVVISENNDEYHPLLKYMLESSKRSVVVDDMASDCVPDVIILLSKKDKVLKDIWQAKLVITLPNTLSPSQKSLLKKYESTLIELGFADVLSKYMVPKHLHDVAKWMKKNEKELSMRVLQNLTLPAQIHIATGRELLIDNKRHQDNLFDDNATYLVTGGLTGLGWEIVKLIVEMGAKKVCTMSRRTPNQEQMNNLEVLTNTHGCRIVHFQADVSELHSVQHALNQIACNLGRVKGIFHCAGVLDSQVVIRLDLSAIENVLKPKVLGALNLHNATLNMKLDFFVLASSVTSLIGTPGQSNYGAANNFLDAYAIFLRQKGFACQSIRWGALDLGMVKDYNLEENMRRRGHRLMSVPEIRSCFRFQLMANSTGVVCADLDWDLIAFDHNNNQMQTVVHKIRNCIEENVTKNIDEDTNIEEDLIFDIEKLQTMGRDVQVVAVQAFVKDVANRIVRDDSSGYTILSKLMDMGFDSMSVITFRNIIYDYTGCRIPFELLNESETTFMFVAEYLQTHCLQ